MPISNFDEYFGTGNILDFRFFPQRQAYRCLYGSGVEVKGQSYKGGGVIVKKRFHPSWKKDKVLKSRINGEMKWWFYLLMNGRYLGGLWFR